MAPFLRRPPYAPTPTASGCNDRATMLRHATPASTRIDKGILECFDALRRPGGASSARWEADYTSCRCAAAVACGSCDTGHTSETEARRELVRASARETRIRSAVTQFADSGKRVLGGD